VCVFVFFDLFFESRWRFLFFPRETKKGAAAKRLEGDDEMMCFCCREQKVRTNVLLWSGNTRAS
jgi:hypothetical protein